MSIVINKNSHIIDPLVYTGLAAFTVQPYTEINAKNGTQYVAQLRFNNVAPATDYYFSFTTGVNPVLIKKWLIEGFFVDLSATIYTGASITGGTVQPYGNLNDRTPVAGTVEITTNPTVVDEGTIWQPQLSFIGTDSAKNVSDGLVVGEYVLKENTTYLVKMVNNHNQTSTAILTYFTWYEGPLDLEIREV